MDLFHDNIKLVYHHLNRRQKGKVNENDKDDYKQELLISLWIASRKYKPGEYAFSSYAMKILDNKNKEFWRKKFNPKRMLNDEAISMNIENEDGVEIGDLIPSNLSVEDEAILNINLQKLDDEEIKLLILYQYYTEKEIAKIMGKHRSSISRMRYKLFESIKKQGS